MIVIRKRKKNCNIKKKHSVVGGENWKGKRRKGWERGAKVEIGTKW